MSSPFASRYTDTLSLPTDPTETITIQRVPGDVIERAQAVHLHSMAAGRTPRGWAGVFQKILAAGTATAVDAQKALDDPLAGYDRHVLVADGVKAWTYKHDDGTPKPVTAEAIADLDDEAMEYLAVAIMKLTKPALFAVNPEAAQKND
jgi:hypothetical protein